MLPAGTAIQRPGAPIELIHETRWLLTRPALEKVLVQAADLKACEAAVKACEARAAGADLAPSFWRSPTGHVVLGLAFGATAGAGVYAGTRLK